MEEEQTEEINEVEEDELKDFREMFEQALELKDKLGLPSVDTALLMMISQDIDTIRFHNSD